MFAGILSPSGSASVMPRVKRKRGETIRRQRRELKRSAITPGNEPDSETSEYEYDSETLRNEPDLLNEGETQEAGFTKG